MADLSRYNIALIAGTLGQGGAEKQLYYILRELKRSGARVRLYCLTRREFWEEPIRNCGVDVVCFGENPSRPARLWQLMQLLREDKPDIIQSQHFYTNLYAAVAARLLGCREIGALRNDVVSEMNSVGRLMGYLSLRLPRHLAANSRAAIRNAVSLGVPQQKLHYLPNVIDADQFPPGAKPADGVVQIAAIGRLVRQKRFDRLLRALDRARSQTTVRFRAVIAGDGPLRGELERLSADLGLEEIVEFRGAVGDPRQLYRESEILTLTSDWEGTPNVIIEAMSSGLAVLATDAGDLPELIENGRNGLSVERQNEQLFVAALVKLLQNQDLRREIGDRARRRVIADRSPEQLAPRLQTLYQTVLA